MRLRKASVRADISVTLALSIIAVFTLGSYAAASRVGDDPFPTQGLPPQAPTGVLNVRGSVTINGNAAASGATVVSGNSIAAGHDGYASIELGTLGRIELQDHTGVTATFAPGSVQLILDQCGSLTQTVPPGVSGVLTDPHYDTVHIKVSAGVVHIKWDGGKEKDIAAGDDTTVDNFVVLSTAGGATYTLACGVYHKAVLLIPLGVVGLAALAFGVSHINNETPAISPSVP